MTTLLCPPGNDTTSFVESARDSLARKYIYHKFPEVHKEETSEQEKEFAKLLMTFMAGFEAAEKFYNENPDFIIRKPKP